MAAARFSETSEKIYDYMRCNNPEGYNSAFEHHQPVTPKNLYDLRYVQQDR
jgi:hypothetical protein